MSPTNEGPSPSLRSLSAVVPAALEGEHDEVLASLCHEVAELVDAEVVSIYLREADDDLVIAGNVGLSSDVVGNLRLHMGEGAVGHAAASQGLVELTAGGGEAHFKPIRGIGEEAFPVLLAWPLLHRGRSVGVLVLQRRATPFDDAARRLAGVLAAAATLVVAATLASAAPHPEAVSACLHGTAVSPGSGLGRVDLVPTAEALSRAAPVGPDRLADALGRVDRDLARLRSELSESNGDAARALSRLELLVADTRLRDHLLSGDGRSLSSLARDYARAPFRVAQRAGDVDEELLQRARDIEELCVVLHGFASGRLLQGGRIWIGERLGGFLASSAAPRAVAVVLDGDSDVTADGLAIARAAGLPVVAKVSGLFSWSRPGDLLAVDADRGVVRINPSATRVMRARAAAAER